MRMPLLLGLMAVVLVASGLSLAGPPDPPATPSIASAAPYYHLRVVRVTGAEASLGAAVRCDGFCGRPIVAPAEEAWGTPAQLDALAKGLGGTRAMPVTGYIVRPDPSGTARFEATVYPGETSVRLRFTGKAPIDGDAPHDLSLELLPMDGGVALAEARVLAAPQRTVAIAAPSPLAGEWLVLAVTALAPSEAERRIAADTPIELVVGEIEAPTLLEKVEPAYPPAARKEGRQGKVIIQAVIDAEGHVRAPTLLKVPEGCEDLAAAVVDSVSRWKYAPATRHGVPVTVYFTVVVNFKLE
ncbi:MAG: energy transducer TonB [Acidobacteria bacterium]|nr:energy transducer TonB [Acidobacteriota bacterium]